MRQRLLIVLVLLNFLVVQKAYSEDQVQPKNTGQAKEIQTIESQYDPITLDKDTDASSTDTPASPLLQFGHLKKNQIFSPSNMTEDLKNSAASVEIITREELDITKPVSLREALSSVGNFTTYSNGSIGNLEPFRLRGWNRSLMELDGLRVNNASFGQPFLNDFIPDDLERIEILKGPQGTVHGTQAQGGLISLFTRRGEGPLSVEFGSAMGNPATFREHAAVSGGNDLLDYYIGVTGMNTDGGSKTTVIGGEDKSRNDSYGNVTAVSNVGARLFSGKAELRNIMHLSNSRKEIGNQTAGFPAFDVNASSHNFNLIQNTMFTHKPCDWYDYSLQFGLVKTRQKNLDPFDPFDSPFDDPYFKVDNNRLMLQTQHNLRYRDINTLTFGYELEFNDFENKEPVGGVSKDIVKNDVYLNDVLNIKNILFLRGGARISDSNLFGTHATPNASAALVLPTFNVPDAYTKLKFNWGYSINEPNPFQLFGAFGNPLLEPEKIDGWDVGIVQSVLNDRVNFEFGYFKNDIKKLIGFDPVTFASLNIDRARTSGWEMGVTVQPVNGLKATVNYSYVDAEQRTAFTGGAFAEQVAAPNNVWNILLTYQPNPKFSMFARAGSNSSRLGFTRRLNGFWDVSVGATLRLFKVKGFNVYGWAKLNNILNNEHELIENYYQPGIHFLAGITVN